jgi:hypothetical protein
VDTLHALSHPSHAAQLAEAGYVVVRGFLEAPFEPGSALDARMRNANLEQQLGAFTPGIALELLRSRYTATAAARASQLDAAEVRLGACLALDACGPASGRVFGWKGSHLVAAKPRAADYVRPDDFARDLAIALVNARLSPQFIELGAGDLLVWAGGFVHGEAPASLPAAPRRTLVLQYGARI